jgi:hypothetical protein
MSRVHHRMGGERSNRLPARRYGADRSRGAADRKLLVKL